MNRVSASPLGWALAGGGFAVIALAGYWIVLFQIVRTPPNVLPDLSKYPSLTVALVLAMSSLVSPTVEEVGFRGYCQQNPCRASLCLELLLRFSSFSCWPMLAMDGSSLTPVLVFCPASPSVRSRTSPTQFLPASRFILQQTRSFSP